MKPSNRRTPGIHSGEYVSLTEKLSTLFEGVLDDLADMEGKYEALLHRAEQVVTTASKRRLDVKELLEEIEELKERIRIDKD